MDGNILRLLEALDLNVDGMEWMTRAIMALFEYAFLLLYGIFNNEFSS